MQRTRTEVEAPRRRRAHVPQADDLTPNKSRKSGFRLPKWLRWGLVVLVVALALDAVYVAVRIPLSLSNARSAFEEAGVALGTGRLDVAETSLSEALDQADAATAAAAGRHPSSFLVSLLPRMGNDIEALRAISEAASSGARAGLDVVDASRAAGEGDSLIGSLYSGGRIKFDAVKRIEPFISRAERQLASARLILRRAPTPSIGRIQAGLEEARVRVAGVASGARTSRLALQALPSLFAEGTTKRYLLAFQSPSEARATGGLIGLLGTLEVRNGRVGLTSLTPTSSLVATPFKPVKAPGWFERRYASLSSLNELPQVNLSPSFPVVSEVLLRMFEKVKGPRLDGVVAMDPFTLQALLPATGPIAVPGLDSPVAANNVANLLLRDSYLSFTPAQQNRRLSALVRRFWDKVRAGQFAPAPFVSGLGQSVETGHFRMYARDTSDQRVLGKMSAAGALPTDVPNPQMVFHNNAAYTKVDYYIKRSLDTTVELDQQGAAHVTTTAVITNDAPPGPPSPLIGPNVKGDAPGLNRMFLNFLIPSDAEFEDFSLNGGRAEPLLATEGPFPVVWHVVEIPAGATAAVEVSYTLPRAVELSGDSATFSMTLLPQSTVTADRYSLTVVPPYGFAAEIEGSSPDDPVRVSGTLDRERPIRVFLQAR